MTTVFSFRQDTRYIDKDLVGTWYTFHNGRIQYFTFNLDGTFELNYQNAVVNKEYFERKGLKSSLTFTTSQTKASAKQLVMQMQVTTPDTAMHLKMTGIYLLINDSTLKIDLASDDELPITNFTKSATTFYKTNNIASLIRKYNTSTYLFTKKTKNGFKVDTVKSTDKAYLYLDSIYTKYVIDKNENAR